MHDGLTVAFAEHYEHADTPYDEWITRAREHGDFDPSLWWLVRRDGEPVAAARCDDQKTGGYIGAVGVLAGERGHGLGRALLLTAFREFYRRGRRAMSLHVDNDNVTNPVPLYEAVGMHVAERWDIYEFSPAALSAVFNPM